MSEFVRVSQAALEALQRGQTVALATVVRVRGSAPRHEGARMLIWPDGRIVGTVGGATLEERVIEDARQSLASGHGRLSKYIFSTDGDPESVGLCGGEVEVDIEVLEPDPEMLIIGAGHVAQPVAAIAHLIGMHVTVVDDRPAFATRDRLPQADVVAVVPYDAATESLDPLPAAIGPATHVVVATWGWDEPALAQVLAVDPPPAYVGLVASPTKARAIFDKLAQRGVPQSRLDLVRAPIGLDLGAETPEEIALAIVAEILAVRRKASGRPLIEARKPRQALEGA